MKNFKFFAIFAIVMVFASCTEKFGAKDNLMGWIWNDQTHAPEVINIDGDPVGRAETLPQLIAADTLQFQGNSGAEVEGQWSKSGIFGMGDQVEFAFVYDGSKHSQITAQVALTLRFESEDVYALDKYTLRGTLREVSHEDAPFLQTSVASLVLSSESGDQIIRKDVVVMVGAMLHDTVIVHVHDTIHTHSTDTVVVHDTAYIYVHDSIVVHDTTIIRDTTTTVVHDSVVNVTVRERRQWCLGWDPQPIFEAGEWRLYATDSLVEKTTVNGNVSYERKSFRHYDVYNIPAFSGNFDGSQEGNCYFFGANGIVTAGGQTVTCQWLSSHISGQVLLHGENVTSSLDKHRSAPSRLCFNGGVATYYFRDMQNVEVATLTRNYNNDVQREYLYSDTAWNCGSVTSASYNAGVITYAITRTGTITRHYSAAPTTEPGGSTTSSTTYTYSVTMSGQVAATMVGQTKNVNSNTANFNGFSITMMPGTQSFCEHIHNTVTMTSTGLVVNGSYNGSTTTVTIPITLPGQWPNTALAWGSDSYYTDIVDNVDEDRQTNAIVMVPSTLKFYAHEWQANIQRNQCDSITLTSAQYNFIMTKVNSGEGWVPCKVYDHNNPTIWYPGVVRSQQLTSGAWKLTYMRADTEGLAYYMSQSSWTIATYNGRDANRGQVDANGTLSFDDHTLQVF